jgi:acyl-CoA thioester hydrolase
MGHANNAVYFTYFEMARTAYVRALGLRFNGGSFQKAFPFILAEIGCSCMSAVEITDLLKVHTRIARMGRKSFEFDYLITSATDGRNVAAGRSVQVYYDYETGQTLPIPDDFAKLIEEYEGRTFER